MKQLSTRTISIISLIAIAILALGVFVIQKIYNTPLPVVENEVEQKENPKTNDETFITDVDMNIDNWQTKETEFFTIKFPKEWYWMESEVITNNPNFDIDKNIGIGIFSDIGPRSILELNNNTEMVISFRGSSTTDAGTPQDRLDSIFELAKENNPLVKCEVLNNKTIPFTAYCSVEYENSQLQQSYYTINEEISLTSTAMTTQETFIEKRILDKIAQNIVLKTGFPE